jgi:hypothetical protein
MEISHYRAGNIVLTIRCSMEPYDRAFIVHRGHSLLDLLNQPLLLANKAAQFGTGLQVGGQASEDEAHEAN